ncbi:hypothetical protein R5R35_005214 [Gryllus longicercus]|uniref:Uncharacterized protein n=1 Tax=Gryllus longicercus TaxID=2509291 RepID=A0AAN9V730_9ORTH
MNFIVKLGIFVVATCLFPDRVLSQSTSGKYKYIHMTSLESCEDSAYLDVWPFSFTFTKDENDEFVLSFNATLSKDTEPDMKVSIKGQRWFPGSGWKTFYPHNDTNICVQAWEQFPEFMQPLFDAMGLPFDPENPENNCPVPAGEYITKPIQVKYQFAKYPELPYGEMRSIFSIMDGDERMICLVAICEVVPEGNGNPFG